MKYCEKCGAKNRDDAKFCEGCGTSLPKVIRALARKRAEAPEVPVRYRAGRPRVGLIVVVAVIIGIVALIAVLALIVLRGASPEDVVRSYAAAVEKGDFAKARELSTGDNMASWNSIQEVGYNQIKASYPNFTYKIEILELKITSQTTTETTIYIRDRETISNAGPNNTTVEYSGNVYLTKVGDKWKISNMAIT